MKQNTSLKLKMDDKKITIRRLSKRDLPHILDIIKESFDDSTVDRAKMNYDQFFRFGHDKDRIEVNQRENWISVEYYVVEIKVKRKSYVVATFGIYTMSWSTTSYWLGWISVHPDWRRQGIGTMCLEVAQDYAKQKGARIFCIETSQLYEDAILFYNNNGFKICGSIDKYYSEKEPVVFLMKNLTKECM